MPLDISRFRITGQIIDFFLSKKATSHMRMHTLLEEYNRERNIEKDEEGNYPPRAEKFPEKFLIELFRGKILFDSVNVIIIDKLF